MNFQNVHFVCVFCNITNLDLKHINSTIRDCIITLAVNKVDNVFPYIRTLRTTGCKATVFILFDDAAYNKLSKDTFELFRNCSINIYNIGQFPSFSKYPNVFAHKHIYIFDFLYKVGYLFDRILLADLYDSVFQKDPFFESVDPEAFTVSTEARFMIRDQCNKAELFGLERFPDDQINKVKTLNAGIMYGSPEIIMKYQTLYFHSFDIFNVDQTHKVSDQGYLNYFNIKKELRCTFEKLNIWYHDQGFETLASIYPHLPKCLQLGELTYSNTKAVIVHQFDRSEMLVAMVLLSCPKGNFTVYPNSYTRIISGLHISVDSINKKYLGYNHTN